MPPEMSPKVRTIFFIVCFSCLVWTSAWR